MLDFVLKIELKSAQRCVRFRCIVFRFFFVVLSYLSSTYFCVIKHVRTDEQQLGSYALAVKMHARCRGTSLQRGSKGLETRSIRYNEFSRLFLLLLSVG